MMRVIGTNREKFLLMILSVRACIDFQVNISINIYNYQVEARYRPKKFTIRLQFE